MMAQFFAGRNPRTIEFYTKAIEDWFEFLRDNTTIPIEPRALLNVEPTVIRAYWEVLAYKRKWAKSTIRVYRAALGGLYEEILDTFNLDDETNPFTRRSARLPTEYIPVPKPHDGLEWNDVIKLLYANRKNARKNAILSLFFGAGLRVNEVLHLKRQHVHRTKEYTKLELLNTKSKDYDTAYVPSWVGDAIDKYLAQERPSPTISWEHLGDRVFGCDSIGLRRTFKKCLRKAGLSLHYSPHCGRVSLISMLKERGVPNRDICYLTRHTEQTMQRYDRKFDKNLARAAQFIKREPLLPPKERAPMSPVTATAYLSTLDIPHRRTYNRQVNLNRQSVEES